MEREFRKEKILAVHKRQRAKMQEYQDAKLPSFLYCARRRWPDLIATGITTGQLKRCCLKGCRACLGIGWIRAKTGTIVNLFIPRYTTGEYGRLKGVSAKTISRLCDDGLITFFRLPGALRRYIVDADA